jgi:hypothetical protein
MPANVTVIDAAVIDLKKWIVERMARMKDSLDREGFLAGVHEVADELWDTRANYDAKTTP